MGSDAWHVSEPLAHVQQVDVRTASNSKTIEHLTWQKYISSYHYFHSITVMKLRYDRMPTSRCWRRIALGDRLRSVAQASHSGRNKWSFAAMAARNVTSRPRAFVLCQNRGGNGEDCRDNGRYHQGHSFTKAWRSSYCRLLLVCFISQH